MFGLIHDGSDGLMITVLFGIESLAADIIESENCSAHLLMSSVASIRSQSILSSLLRNVT